MGEMITITTADGDMDGYIARPSDARAGVIVLQEWWGLNDQIKRVADRFAEAGYAALAPDLYRGRVTQDPDEANHMMTGLDWVGATETDVAAATKHLRRDVDKVAVMGFCMGGALTVIAGVKLAGCDAAVCYYGIPPVEQADPAQMRGQGLDAHAVGALREREGPGEPVSSIIPRALTSFTPCSSCSIISHF